MLAEKASTAHKKFFFAILNLYKYLKSVTLIKFALNNLKIYIHIFWATVIEFLLIERAFKMQRLFITVKKKKILI